MILRKPIITINILLAATNVKPYNGKERELQSSRLSKIIGRGSLDKEHVPWLICKSQMWIML